MKRWSRLSITLSVVAFSAFGLVLATPSVSKSLGIDFWNLPSLQEELQELREAGQKLTAEDEAVLRRIRLKNTIISELLDGRITLFEAAAEFRELSAAHPQYMQMLTMRYPYRSANEIYCLNVIEFVESNIQCRPSATPEIVQYLRDQLALHKHHNGGQVILP